MRNNPKLLLYILMLSSLGINTPLSIIGIISEISQIFNTSIALSGLYVSSFTFAIAIFGLFTPMLFSKFERKTTFVSILSIFAISNVVIIFTNNIFVASFFRILSAAFYPAFISIALTVCEEKVNKSNIDIALSEINDFCQRRYGEKYINDEKAEKSLEILYNKLKEIKEK